MEMRDKGEASWGLVAGGMWLGARGRLRVHPGGLYPQASAAAPALGSW